ncbi:TPA: hypothetical protein ACH3X1_004301 [Trebouxia sp. C0004]
MLVEPLLPKAWRKELDKQKTLTDDVDTDLYAIGIGEQDVAQASEEEGSPLGDELLISEGPEMAKLSLKDDEDEERDEMLNLCSCLDGVISQLQKRMETLDSYQPQQSAETYRADQSKIADMHDKCAYVHMCMSTRQHGADIGRHPVAEINKAALSTLAGHMCSFCTEVAAQIQQHSWLQVECM